MKLNFSKEQIYIVTGASSGLGESTAILLNELGATVVAIARDKTRLENMKSKCKFSENIFIEIKDLTENIEDLPQYITSLKQKYGKFSGIAYCAGIGGIKPLQMLNIFETKKVFDINYFAPIMMAKGFADKRNNVGKGASAVFIASIAASWCDKGMTTYAGSKAALISSMRCIAKENAKYGIRFNCVSPSDIHTPMTSNLMDEHREEKYPMGFGQPIDVANVITFLLSKETNWITAQNYIIDCGVI